MKKFLAVLLSSCLLSSLLMIGGAAATLQSNQAVYRLTQDPVGTQSFSYSETQAHTTTLVPLGTVIQSDSGSAMMVEIFTYQAASGFWKQTAQLSSQTQLEVGRTDEIYHISTLAADGSLLDRGIWVRGENGAATHPIAITGEPVDEWALDLVNQAISLNLMPAHLKGQDLRANITRTQFAALAVHLYEAVSGTVVQAPATSPFTDTSDTEVAKAHALGLVGGVSETEFGVNVPLNREQAATILSALCKALGSNPSAGTVTFTDSASISSWAMPAVSYMAQNGVVAGYDDGTFRPHASAQRQACLIMALRVYQMYQS